MIDVFFFSNITGNTARFVKKLNLNKNNMHQIPLRGEMQIDTVKPYIIITPTYGDGEGKGMVPHQVKKFLKKNSENLIGVVSAGNRNFGKEFGLAGDLIAYKFNVPLLYKFEIAGTDQDIQEVQNIIKNLDKTIGDK